MTTDDPARPARTHPGLGATSEASPGGGPPTGVGGPFVVVGSPVSGTSVAIRTATGDVVSEQHVVGEIEVSGRSVAAGYFDAETQRTVPFEGGRVPTGDLGYLCADGLVVCGRRKDVIVVSGRNVYPQEIERRVSSVPGVRSGSVAAVMVDEPRRFKVYAVLFETAEVAPEAVRRRVARAATELVGERPAQVVPLPPGTLPKTTSGKLQRGRCIALLDGSP